MRFAQWLSPKFAIKVDELIIKLLTGEVCLLNPADIAGVLPKLVYFNGIYIQGFFYPYVELLQACGCSTRSGSVRQRTRKNPQEFIKGDNGVLLVTERYGKAIYYNSVSAKLNSETRVRRLDFQQQRALQQAKVQ
jgi:hypothetical protein